MVEAIMEEAEQNGAQKYYIYTYIHIYGVLVKNSKFKIEIKIL